MTPMQKKVLPELHKVKEQLPPTNHLHMGAHPRLYWLCTQLLNYEELLSDFTRGQQAIGFTDCKDLRIRESETTDAHLSEHIQVNPD